MKKIKSLRSNYFQVSILFLLCAAVIIPKNRILARFPWQDLIYCDFQIYKQWQFFSSSVKSDGIVNALLAAHNFGINMGENIYVSSRVSPAIFDVGAWIFLATNNLDLASMGKLLIHFIICFIGFKRLYNLAYPKASLKRDLFFIISLVSVLSHPVLYHEVGPMVFWYLLLTPTWVYFFLYAQSQGINFVLRNRLFYLLILLTIGSSDLFIYFFFPFIALLAFFLSKFKGNFFSLVKLLTLIEFFMLLPKIPYVYYSMSNEIIAKKGSYDFEFYISTFIIPLLQHSVFFIYFTGPVLIFLNAILLISVLYLSMHHWNASKRYLIFLLSLLVILISLGLLLHSVPFINNQLPSAFRYHVVLWPFVVACILPFWSSEITLKNKLKLAPRGYSFFALLLIITFLISNSSAIYQDISPNASKKIINSEMRTWLLKELPDCINEKTNSGKSNRSFIFMTPDTEKGRNDTLLFLMENPSKLNGRTFNQWSYATNKANYLLNTEHDLLGLNSWAFTDKKFTQATNFATRAQVSYLLSTTSINSRHPGYNELGSCKFPEKLRQNATPFKSRIGNYPIGNPTLASTVYIYEINAKYEDSPVNVESIDLTSITFGIECNSTKEIILPVGYSRDIRVTYSEGTIKTVGSKYSMVELESIDDHCGSQQKISVKVESHSKVLYANLGYFLVLMLMMITGSSFVLRARNKRD
jgi:hypothetical protein